MVALKRWSAAQRDGDPVHALILGAAINHDGGRSGDPVSVVRHLSSHVHQAHRREDGLASAAERGRAGAGVMLR
jgi:acyl transferase domain-containing protein